MKINVTIDIFSGRPNPTLTLEGNEAEQVLREVQTASDFSALTDQDTPEPFNLGFRGIIIEQTDDATTDLPTAFRVTPDRLYTGNSSATARDTNFEKIIFDRLTKFRVPGSKKTFEQLLRNEVAQFRLEREQIVARPPIIIDPIKIFPICRCAPASDIAWWNDGSTRQFNNNCYNYATNYRTNTFAQPGKAAGQQYTSLAGCIVGAGQRSARDGAVADALIDLPNADNKCPATGHLVALVVWPGVDYHWYRKGPNGRWSHKPGSTAATLLDNAGNAITDPRTANRGNYTQFCTFMQAIHGHVMIR
ncbi:hypothetical protein [Spirosoma montaniterrae]|uniref:Uncharacterized protein n=1 Tax=Spirosoma montaniterrae TaxID=1178516 RepID=A0A1P9WYV7_9BACT|nr:hypothetical protein [Spirosoma montaniterrae]AQG80561.1 hypothetical protein AWR27_15260 [Spirosoma montaniterrae]